MGTILSNHAGFANRLFQVNYPYYGLFGTAEVKVLQQGDDQLFECRLVNGAKLLLKRLNRKWIDLQSNTETPLAAVIGKYIEDKL